VRNVDATQGVALQDGAKILYEAHDFPDLGTQAILADPQGAVFAILASSTGDPPDVLADPGEWIWSSLITSDPDKAAAFYQVLFDYSVFDLPGDSNAQHLILASDDFARASVNPLPATWSRAHPHWLNYIRVDDAAATVGKVVPLGGHVVIAPQIDRHGAKVAVVSDPTGALFGLMEWRNDGSSRGVK
jgi:predicted enzyme related to lactoylglutathione lyase